MKQVLAVVGVVVGLIVLLVGLTFGLSYLGLIQYQFFGPRYQGVERKIFEETPSFVEGKEQTLSELRLEYQRAKTSGEKDNIKAMIINEAATVDLDKLKDASLRRFVEDLRSS